MHSLDKRMLFEIAFMPILTIIYILTGAMADRDRELDIQHQIDCHDDFKKCWIIMKHIDKE